MKRILILIILILFSLTLFGIKKVVNDDKPLKGKWDFKLNKVWEVDTAGKDMLVRVGSIRIGKNGKVYALDYKLTKIFVFDKDGKFLHSIGKKGEGPGEYKNAYSFELIDDTIIVPDMGKFHYFKTTGEYINSINSGAMIFPNNFIDKYTILEQKEKNNKDSKIDVLRTLNLKTKKSNKITEFIAPKPKKASTGGMTLIVKEMIETAVKNKKVYFGKGNANKYLIKVNNLSGKELLEFSIKGRKKIKVSEETKRKKYERIIVNGGKMPKTMVDQMIKNDPDYAPFYKKIYITSQEFVYIYRDDPMNQNVQGFDIFSADGKYLYHAELKLPDDLIIKSRIVFHGDNVYVFAEDEEGESKLYKFKTNLPE